MSAAIVTIGLAFAGYLVTYLNGLRLAQRQERLARVNRQLSEFYGPLLALVEINNRVYRAFAERHPRPDGRSPMDQGPEELPPTDEELAEWRLWIAKVFLPNHRAMRDILVNKADLLSEPHMPPILMEVYAHASWHEIAVTRWEQGDLAVERPPSPFPMTEIRRYVRESFDRLKREQAALLGRRRNRVVRMIFR
ncbi:hypothetical protein ACFU6R_28310 [Streptomyces sp. NPDC057499]|uniref:hypothetical protein n=1 Tax=Streptomyces sp. NPDC057499 TaxID=3346150 RepID=UPI0036904902